MVLVLGAGTYIGRLLCSELRRRGHDYALPPEKDYADFHSLFDCIRRVKPEFLINAAGHIDTNMDAEELPREEVLRANTILPRFIAQVCLMTNTPWGHISSCGIYSGAKIIVGTGIVVEKKFTRLELLRLIAECPEKIRGFTEADEPNFSFRHPPCSFFSGTSALAEEAIQGIGRNYIWRLGLPFNERDEPENFLRQIINAQNIHNGIHPFSHTDDFARGCLDLWERHAAFGIYNIANPGLLSTGQIAEVLEKTLGISRHFEFRQEDADIQKSESRTPHSHCILDVSKLLATGATMRPAMEAIEDSLRNWRPESTELHRAAA